MGKHLSIQTKRDLAGIVRTERNRLGWSQEKLARKSGRSLSYIQKIENVVRANHRLVDELLAVMAKHGNGRKSA